jgi:hypothetical protein
VDLARTFIEDLGHPRLRAKVRRSGRQQVGPPAIRRVETPASPIVGWRVLHDPPGMVLCITPRSPMRSGEPLGRVACAEVEIRTLRVDTSGPQQGMAETASLNGGQTSDREFALISTLAIGADVPGGVVAVTRFPTRGGSAV